MGLGTPQDIAEWLRRIGLSQYEDAFRTHAIDVDLLRDLTDADLKEINIPLGDRKRLLKAIAEIAQPQGAAQPELRETRSHDPGRAERRQVTIMFCDLENSTVLANELDPEDLAEVLRGYRSCVEDVVARWQGYIARYYGDGALVYFGWPQAREDDAERAVRAGLDLTARVDRQRAGPQREPLRARVGVATGVVMIGEWIGEGSAKEESVFGPIPNLAARLQALVQPGGVAIAATTHRLVAGLFEWQALGLQNLKGFPEPMEVWRPLRGVETIRFERRSSQDLTPFVGRQAEVTRLLGLWSEAAAGAGRTALLVGEAGIGKSRLAQELRQALGDAEFDVLHWQASPFHANVAFHPVVQALRRLFCLQAEDSSERRRLKAAELGVELGAHTPAFEALLSRDADPYSPAPRIDVRFDHIVELVAHIVRSLARRKPLLLVIEDAHWADPSTMEAMKRLLAVIPGERVLALITSRPEIDFSWASEVAKLDLERLTSDAARSMVHGVAHGKALAAPVLEAILATTDGVPLFIEEFTRTVLESGQLRDLGDRFDLNGPALNLSVPATLRDSLAARLDRLGGDKYVAQAAATIGRSFSADLLAALLDGSPSEVERALGRLCEAGVLTERAGDAQPTYVFRQSMMQEAAYRSQLNARRRELHARVGAMIESRYPDRARSSPDLLAHHFAEAGLPEPAARYMLAASRNALRLSATHEAITRLNQALALLSAAPAEPSHDLIKLRLHATLGTALMMSKSWAAPEAEAAYNAAHALSHVATDPIESMWILWGVFVYRQVRGHMAQAVEATSRLRAAAERHGDVDSRLVADMVCAQVSFYTGRFEEADRHCLAVAAAFTQSHRPLIGLYTLDLQVVALVHRALACWALGRSQEASALADEAERVTRALSHPYTLAWTLTWGAMVRLLEGEFEELGVKLDEGIAIAERHAFSYIAALGRMMRGWRIGADNAPEAGVAEMTAALRDFEATGAGIVVPFFRTLLADLLSRAGQAPEALAELDAAEAQVERGGETWSLAELYRVRGEVLGRRDGDAPDAATWFDRALAVAAAQGAPGWQSRARMSLTRLGENAAYEAYDSDAKGDRHA